MLLLPIVMSRKREEAIAAGIHVNDIQHTMKRRTPSHNYCDKGTYMLTLVVDGRMPLFGTLKGNVRLPLSGTLKGDGRMPLSGPLKGDERRAYKLAQVERLLTDRYGNPLMALYLSDQFWTADEGRVPMGRGLEVVHHA